MYSNCLRKREEASLLFGSRMLFLGNGSCQRYAKSHEVDKGLLHCVGYSTNKQQLQTGYYSLIEQTGKEITVIATFLPRLVVNDL